MATPDEVLTIRTDVDTRSATQQFVKFQREVMRQLDRVTQAVEATGAANSKVSKKAQEDAEDWSKGLKNLGKYYQDETNKINALQKALNKAEKARQEGDESSRKAAERRAKALKKELDQHKKAFKDKAVTTTFDSSKMGGEATKALGAAADNFKSTISSFFSKDLKGVILGGGGLVKHLTKAAAKGLAAGGDKLVGMGTAMGRKGAAKGGGMGAGMGALGQSLKSLGGLGRTLGPVIGSLAKLGPLLGIVGAGIAGLVKLFIDAESQAKEFQKSILQSASTSEYLSAAAGDADVAYANLADDMKSVRDAAYSLDNLKWGISAEQHKTVLNALTQEGVTLHDMRKEAELAGKSMGEYTAQLTQVSVAYSRNFGVPLQEINQFQSEMMKELGMNLESTQLAFSQMTRSASESGIAANKFFSIIRGVSQDLSLYNVRMGSAIKLLGMLGKVMNPRNAQKFMQTAMQGMKQMGQDERLKVALLAGGKGQEIVKKDLENRRKNLYRDIAKAIGGEAEDVQKRLSDPKQAKALWAQVEKTAEGGALRESALELQIDTSAAKKGVYGQAFAMENLGAGATIDMMTAAIAKWGGGKSLMEGAGSLGMTKMAEMLGINTQQLRGMMKLEVAVREQKEALLEQGKKELADAKAKDDKEAEAAAQRKIQIATTGTTQDILDTLSEEEQNTLKEATKSELDFAKEQSKLTQTLTEQLQVIIDFLMNQLYNVLIDIWETISDIPGLGGSSEARKAKIAAARAGGGMSSEVAKTVADAVSKGGEGGADIRKAVGETKSFQRMLTALGSGVDVSKTEKKRTALDVIEERLKQGRTSESEEEWAKLSKEWTATADKLRAEIAAEEKIAGERTTAERILNAQIKQQGGEGGVSAGKAVYAALGQSPDTAKKVRAMQSSMESGTSFSAALEQAGFSPEEMGQIMQKAMQWFTSDQQLAGGAAEFEAAMKTQDEAAKAAQEEAQKTSQNTEAAAKAAAGTKDTLESKNTAYVAFSPKFAKGQYKDIINEAVLDALREALFEYYLYSGLDRESVVKTMGTEQISPKDFGKRVGEGVQLGIMPEDFLGLKTAEAAAEGGKGDKKPGTAPTTPGKQHGGLVSHISKEGMAIFRTPPGEGMTAIRAGERIVPAYAQGGGRGGGGGGGAPTHVIVSVSPDAQRLIQTEVRYGINEHERRKRTGG